jgi:hypothetical protein
MPTSYQPVEEALVASSVTITGLTSNAFIYSGTGGLVSSTAAPTNGQLLIGSTGAAPVRAALTGTANQVVVTNGAGSITLSLPQSIATTSSPSFAGLTVTGNGAASAPPAKLTGTWFSGGSATTTKPQLLIEPAGTTSTGWSTSGTGLGVNAASGFAGNLADFQVAGARVASIGATGAITADDTITASGPLPLVLNTASGTRTFNRLKHGGVDKWEWNIESSDDIHLYNYNTANAAIHFSFANSAVTFPSRVGIGTSTFGTNATNTLALFNGTVPSTSPADTVQLFSTDISAGNASLGIRTETAVAVDVETESTHTLSVTINGTVYKILLATP